MRDGLDHQLPDPKHPDMADAGLLAAVFDSIGVAVCVTDLDGVVLAVNPLAERLLGHPPGALLGRSVHQTICWHRPDAQGDAAGTCRLLEVDRAARPVADADDLLLCADGTLLSVMRVSTPLRQRGQSTGVVVAFRDATAEHRARATRAAVDQRGREARQKAEDARATLAWLAELTDELVSTLDAQKSLAGLAHLLVPSFADWVAFDVLVGPGRARRVVWPRSAGAAEAEGGLLPRFTPTSPTPLARVLAGTGSRLMPDVMVAGPGVDAFDEGQRELFASLGATSALLVPLRLRGSTLGVMTLVRVDQQRPFTEDDVALAEEVARRTALSLDSARAYGQQAEIAAVLQRSLLTELPHLADMELAASYRPARQGAEVGGDWYDAFVLRDGELAVVVGDVVGHDLQAASHMGALRNMLRALAVDQARTPGAVLGRLDLAMRHLDVAESATVVCGFLRPTGSGSWSFRWSNAGHPPPLLLSPDGRAEWLEDGHDMLLGVESGRARPTATVLLPPGATLLMYTDGLVESRNRPIDAGLARLRDAAVAEAHRPLTELCATLIDILGDFTDDITVIALRVPTV